MTQHTRRIGDKVVSAFNILTTDRWVYRAYEPTTPGQHACITNAATLGLEGRAYWGTVASRALPPEIAALPSLTDERFNAVRAYQAARDQASYDLIVAAFPEAATGLHTHGQIEVTRP